MPLHTTKTITFKALGPAGSGESHFLAVSEYIQGRVYVEVTAADAGVTGLTVTPKDSHDGVGRFEVARRDGLSLTEETISVDTSALQAASAASPHRAVLSIEDFTRFLAVEWEVEGTGQVTFSVTFVGKT